MMLQLPKDLGVTSRRADPSLGLDLIKLEDNRVLEVYFLFFNQDEPFYFLGNE